MNAHFGHVVHSISHGWVGLFTADGDHANLMLTISHDVRIQHNKILFALLTLLLAGCEFQSSITPIVWPTVGEQPFLLATLGPQPSPVPLAPTPFPPPPTFDGADSLDCAEPQSGDNHFGYCRIPGTREFYAWGECTVECPDGPYPGIQIMTVSEANSAVFREVLDGRDTSIEERRKGFSRGGILGGIGVGLGVPGVIGACWASGSWNFGTGCVIVLGLLGVDALLAGLETKDGFDAQSDLTRDNGFEDSAKDLFQQLREQESVQSDGAP